MFNRNFVLIWQGQMVSQIGSQMFGLALMYWVLQTTGSATSMGLILMSATLPGALFGPFGGVLADRLSRKRLIVCADAVRGCAAIGFVFALWFADARLALPLLVASQIVFGICGATFSPALNASVPELVPHDRLASANSLLRGTAVVTSIVSMSAAGYLYARFGGPCIFLINGVSFLISAAATAFADIPVHASRSPSLRRDTIDGLRFVWSRPGLRILITTSAVLNFVLVPTGVALPIFVRDYLGGGPELLGVMGMCQSIGAIVGLALAGTIKIESRYRARVVVGAMCLVGVAIFALGLTRSPNSSLVLLALFGCQVSLANIHIISVIQNATPSQMRGRVTGLLGTLVAGLIPIAQGLSGALIDALEQRVADIYLAVGVVIVLLAGIASSRPSFRGFLRQ